MTIRETLLKINSALIPKIDVALTKEVFAEVQDEETATIYEEVYKSYTPKMYRRRGQYDGLGDPDNIKIKGGAAKDGKLVVINTTDPNPDGCIDGAKVTTGKDLPELVEFGQGHKFYSYDFPGIGKGYMKPRPFTAKTIQRLKESKAHIVALKAGLKRQGVKTK